MALTLVNTANIKDSDDPAFELRVASGIATGVVGDTTFLFVTSILDSAVNVFSVAADGSVSKTDVVSDDATLELSGAIPVSTVSVGGSTYVIVGGNADDGFSVFSVSGAGTLSNTDNELDDAGSIFLKAVSAVIPFVAGGTTYLASTGHDDDGLTTYSFSGGLAAFNSASSPENASQLDGAKALATATIGGATYLFTAGDQDDGVSVFNILPDGQVGQTADNVVDGGPRFLHAVTSLATALVGGKSYLYASGLDDGISGFLVDAAGFLTNVVNLPDNATLQIDSPRALTTVVIGGTTYLFVTSSGDDGVSAFAVAADGSLVNVANLSDGGSLNLLNAFSVSTAAVGGNFYLFVASQGDNGFSVFRLEPTGLTITGTAGKDIVDATHAPAGQLLPADLSDTIFGFGGNDTLSGLLGNDTIAGGSGEDILTGGPGKDLLKGQTGRDTFDFNAKTESRSANADTVQGFSHAQGDRIDLRTIDATTGGANNVFLFAGTQSFAAFNATHAGGAVRAVDGFVRIDIDGNNTVDMVIKTPGTTLHAADFLL